MKGATLLSGRWALVTGGSRGIGRSIALSLAERGADLVLTYFNHEEAAEETAKRIETLSRKVRVARVNLAYEEEVDRLFDEIEREIGRLDVFVANAVSATLRPLADLPVRHWRHIVNANLTSFLLGSQRALRLMEPRGGHIIAVSSLGSRLCLPGYGALGAAKAAVETLVRYMAAEWAERGVRVNAVSAGPVDTEALNAFDGAVPDVARLKEDLGGRSPLKRLGRPADVAGLVTFLCSPEAEWIRGQTLIADGGFSLT